MGLVDDKGHLETYDGMLRIKDAAYNTLHDAFPPAKYAQIIGEAVEPHSYLKSPFYKPLGYPAGIYRVGPLARMIVADKPGTPLADVAALYFSVMDRQSSFHFHYARLVEILYAFETIEILLNKPYILDKQVRSQAQPNNRDGVGVSEAPRGTLMHHYQIDDNGLITAANLIIATGHNNLAMNRGVKQVAQKFVKSGQLTEGMLNRVEAVIRSFDPCLSCSTHAVGTMPLHVQVVAPDGAVLDEAKR
jgi:NAD-reducing hydrogenase large subunit